MCRCPFSSSDLPRKRRRHMPSSSPILPPLPLPAAACAMASASAPLVSVLGLSSLAAAPQPPASEPEPLDCVVRASAGYVYRHRGIANTPHCHRHGRLEKNEDGDWYFRTDGSDEEYRRERATAASRGPTWKVEDSLGTMYRNYYWSNSAFAMGDDKYDWMRDASMGSFSIPMWAVTQTYEGVVRDALKCNEKRCAEVKWREFRRVLVEGEVGDGRARRYERQNETMRSLHSSSSSS